jgi:hypothetical protein
MNLRNSKNIYNNTRLNDFKNYYTHNTLVYFSRIRYNYFKNIILFQKQTQLLRGLMETLPDDHQPL